MKLRHPVRIFRHELCEGPGYLGDFLQRKGVAWELVCLDRGVRVPMDLDAVAGLIFMGGDMSVNSPLDWIEPELALIRKAHSRGLPMMGTCFGGQLISKALGGCVKPSSKGREIGWHPVQRVPNCRCDHWLDGLADRFLGFHWHGETFEPPPGATPILENHCFHHQAFVLGDSLAMQFHLEMTEKMILGWIREYKKQIRPGARCIQGESQITCDLAGKLQQLHHVADVLYGNWLARVERRAAAKV